MIRVDKIVLDLDASLSLNPLDTVPSWVFKLKVANAPPGSNSVLAICPSTAHMHALKRFSPYVQFCEAMKDGHPVAAVRFNTFMIRDIPADPVPTNVVWSEGGNTCSKMANVVLSSMPAPMAWDIPIKSDKSNIILAIFMLKRWWDVHGSNNTYIKNSKERMPPKPSLEITPHLRSILEKSPVPPQTPENSVTLARASFVLQRKRDALNCYLRTACMRMSGDLVFDV